jgi:hypothetical protein
VIAIGTVECFEHHYSSHKKVGEIMLLPIEQDDYRAELDDRYEHLLRENYSNHFYDHEEKTDCQERLLYELLIIVGLPKTAKQLMTSYPSVQDIPKGDFR